MSGVVTVSRALTPRNWTATTDPTNAWDAGDGVRVGDHWYNTTSGNVFVCTSNTVGAAVWRHIPRTLGQSGAAVALTGTTSITALATVAVPAGAMGVNGTLFVTTTWTCTNNANSKTARFNFGTAGSGTGGTQYLSSNLASTTGARDVRSVTNRNSASSQFGMPAGTPVGGFGTTAGALCTTAIDTTAAAEVCICGILGVAGDTMTLESYRVELTRPDIT